MAFSERVSRCLGIAGFDGQAALVEPSFAAESIRKLGSGEDCRQVDEKFAGGLVVRRGEDFVKAADG